MNVTFEKNGPACGVITVEVTPADYTATVDKKLKEIGKTHTIPGFRKGNVPMNELRKRFGRDVKSDALNHVVYEATMQYIEDNKIKFIGSPLPQDREEKIDLKADDFTFKYDVALYPEVAVKLDKDVHSPFYLIEVTKEMVDEQDKAMRERFGTQQPGEEVDSKAVVKGTIMELDAEGNVRTDADAIQVIDGIVAPFLFKSKDEEGKFIGKHVGDKIVFNPWASCEGSVVELASMLHLDKDKAADVKADFEMTLSEIIVVKNAELGEEYYNNVFGPDKVHNEEEYFEAIKKMIEAQLFPNTLNLSNRDLHDQLLATYGPQMELDAPLLKKWILLNDKNATAESVEADYEGSVPGIKWELLSGIIADQLKVEVTEADMEGQANLIARQQLQQYGMYNMDEETIADMGKRILADASLRRRIAAQLEEVKLFNEIRKAITLDEKTVSLDEFKKVAGVEDNA